MFKLVRQFHDTIQCNVTYIQSISLFAQSTGWTTGVQLPAGTVVGF